MAHINDIDILNKISNLIFADDDTRPGWVGPGKASTDKESFFPLAKWANEHWILYEGFVKDLSVHNNGLILDLGCGFGFCTINLAHTFKNAIVHGIDLNKKCIEFANIFNTSSDNVSFEENDILSCKFPLEIDYIFLIETFEHLSSDSHHFIIDKCLSSLKNENSRLLLSTPNETVNSGHHRGILTPSLFSVFKEKYSKNILDVSYYVNTELLSGDYNRIISIENGSHYRITMGK